MASEGLECRSDKRLSVKNDEQRRIEMIEEQLEKIEKLIEANHKDEIASDRAFICRLERIEKLCEENNKANEGIRAMFENISDSLDDDFDMDLQEKEYIIAEQDGYIKHLEEMLAKANRKIEKQKKKIKKLKREFEYVM